MTEDPTTAAYPAPALVAFAARLFGSAGLDDDKAGTVARVLVEGDLLGHTTHGLALAAPYLRALLDGSMTKAGEPAVIADRGGALCWDGRRLPGPWLVVKAIDQALARVAEHGVAAVAIRESHHIACLAAYLERATATGRMILLTCSDPSEASVAPFGGLQALFTPDPIAFGIPTDGDPILVDMSASITTNGMTARLRNAGQPFPGPWANDRERRGERRSERADDRAARHAAADRRQGPWPQGLQSGARDRGAEPGPRPAMAAPIL